MQWGQELFLGSFGSASPVLFASALFDHISHMMSRFGLWEWTFFYVNGIALGLLALAHLVSFMRRFYPLPWTTKNAKPLPDSFYSEELNPYLLTSLRGKTRDIAITGVIFLIERGALVWKDGKISQGSTDQELSPLETALYEFFQRPKRPSSLNDIVPKQRERMAAWRETGPNPLWFALEAEQGEYSNFGEAYELLYRPQLFSLWQELTTFRERLGVSMFVANILHIFVYLHFNDMNYVYILIFAGTFVFSALAMAQTFVSLDPDIPKLAPTGRGKALLRELRSEYSAQKRSIKNKHTRPTPSTLAIIVGLYGLKPLYGTPFAHYAEMFNVKEPTE